MDFCQHVVLYPAGNYFSVDTKLDLTKVENEFKKIVIIKNIYD